MGEIYIDEMNQIVIERRMVWGSARYDLIMFLMRPSLLQVKILHIFKVVGLAREHRTRIWKGSIIERLASYGGGLRGTRIWEALD
jgi:hypothetical protein